MTQLTIFDVLEVPAVVKASEVVPDVQEVEEPIETAPEMPTYFIDYYDEDGRSRLSWMRAKNEDDAAYKFRKANKRYHFSRAYRSERDFDVLEALD